MGALASNQKRDHQHTYPYINPSPNLNSNSISPEFRVSKKPRLSFLYQSPSKQTLVSSNNTVARIARYPETSPKFRREVHAPCRVHKFGLSKPKSSCCSEKKKICGGDMGNLLSSKLYLAKRYAFDTLRYWGKEKEVVDVDTEHETTRISDEVVSDDSIVEVLEVIDEGEREGQSAILEGKLGYQRGNDNNNNDEVKITEERSVITVDGNVGVVNAEKMLNTLRLDHTVDMSSVEAYKRLLEDTERRSRRLERLEFEIKYNEEKRKSYQLSRPKPVEKPVEDLRHELFMPLTEEEEANIQRFFLPNFRRRILVSHENSNIDITGQILKCLAPGAWLNDEVINLYLELLKERELREPQKFLKCHFFNTFFYKKLTRGSGIYDYNAVRRWTTKRKLGYFLIDCDKIFVPVHREIHWCLAIINKKDQKFQYLDSLMGEDINVLKILARYYVEEIKDKSKVDIDVSNWEYEFLKDLPEQQNGYDCGVFMIKYADFYSRGLGLCFGQEHMPYFRLRTAKEILRLRAD